MKTSNSGSLNWLPTNHMRIHLTIEVSQDDNKTQLLVYGNLTLESHTKYNINLWCSYSNSMSSAALNGKVTLMMYL